MEKSPLRQPRTGAWKNWSMEKPLRFGGGSISHLPEDQLQCSICLDVFTDPITTPCGHNFCKTCLTQCWEKSQFCNCPLCKEKFSKRPELKINTTLREVVHHFKKKNHLDKHEILCDSCTGAKQKALKSCLDCGLTFCESHLEPHNNVEKLKKHKLINPVKNLEEYICQKHEKPLEMFCRDDQTYVCQFCTEGDHKNHNIVPIGKESGEKKSNVGKIKTEVQQIIRDKLKKIQEIKQSVKLSKKNTMKDKAENVELFTALIRSIEKSQAELLEMMEVKQKAAERQAEEYIKELEQEIGELEKLLRTEEHLHLQVYLSVCKNPPTKNQSDMEIDTNPNVETVRKALSQVQKSLNEKLSKTQNEKMREIVSIELKRIQQHAVDVTLDPETAHPILILSEDGKQVRRGNTIQDLTNTPKRFTYYSIILGKQSFTTGRFYYEVQVGGKAEWEIGVARESVNRKGEIVLKPENGLWTVVLRNWKNYMACDDTSIQLFLKVKPQKLGVFVDYEEGLVSFYDVENRSHIYSFTGQSFTETLYPYFWPGPDYQGKNLDPLIIGPVLKTE